MKSTVAAFLLMLCSISHSATPEEINLREVLFDARALMKSSIKKNDFEVIIKDITLNLDRYKRRGGEDSFLTMAAEQYIQANFLWDGEINARTTYIWAEKTI